MGSVFTAIQSGRSLFNPANNGFVLLWKHTGRDPFRCRENILI
jgi:hypothetical protein